MLDVTAPAQLVTAVAAKGGFVPPSIDDFFPPAFAFLNTPFELNRIMLVRIIMTLVLVLAFGIGAARAKLVPGRFQNMLEMLLEFVRKNIAEDVLGERRAARYTSVLTVVFLGILFMNLAGIIPGLQVAGTSVIGMPLVFAIFSYVIFVAAGIKASHGNPFKFFKDQTMPKGVPGVLYVLVTPIEIFSTFIMRPVTLTLRLLANMVSGHILLALCFLATNALFFEASSWFKGLGVITLGLGLVFILFEAFVAVLQAYIFALLTAVYIDTSISAH